MIKETRQDYQLPNSYNYSFKSNLDNKILIFIYQITCKDPNINENYIGQTECFEKRKYSHSRDSQISELKIYKTIREYGGWDNWKMKIINHYYCDNEYEARQIEQKYIDIFKPTMNSVRAYSKPFINEELDRQLEFEINDYKDKTFGCYLYDYYLEFNNIYVCEYCKKEFKSINSLNYHKKSAKYCILIRDNMNIIVDKEIIQYDCTYCKKIFSTNQALQKHLNICKEKIKQNINEINNEILILKEQLFDKNLELSTLKQEHEIELSTLKQEHEIELSTLKQKYENEISILKGQNEVYKTDHECIHKIAQQVKTTTTTTNINNNLIAFDKDIVKDKFISALNNITHKDIYDGQTGVARILAPCLTSDDGKKMIKCNDTSRGIFVTIDEHGNQSKDIKARKLACFIEPFATAKVDEIIDLDDQKRNKINEYHKLKKDINYRKKEIEKYKELSVGLKDKSLKYTLQLIENKELQNIQDQEKVDEYEDEGMNSDEDTDFFDEKLFNGSINIKELNADSTKFSNALAPLIL